MKETMDRRNFLKLAVIFVAGFVGTQFKGFLQNKPVKTATAPGKEAKYYKSRDTLVG